ncbi:MAG TPA: hypothetical protein VED37_16000 [Ktedonobacteraceae bacterium]|nr:hypothetical protein [Ktedonobacteraceae bacterium]
MTTEEWKAEQQLERDAQASETVPVKRMRLARPARHNEQQGASKNLRTAKYAWTEKNNSSLAWIATRDHASALQAPVAAGEQVRR